MTFLGNNIMRRPAFVCLVFAGLCAPALAASLPDPIAPASSGQLQCYTPDTARKTCASLASYTLRADGGIDNGATVMISPSPIVTMQTISRVEIRNGQICGKILSADIQNASFAVNGIDVDATRAMPLRQQVLKTLAAMLNKQVCTAYIRQNDGALIAKATLDGRALPDDQRVIWVSPNDGYKVAP